MVLFKIVVFIYILPILLGTSCVATAIEEEFLAFGIFGLIVNLSIPIGFTIYNYVKKKKELDEEYNKTVESAKQTPKERYDLKNDGVMQFLDIAKRLASNKVQTGVSMLQSDGPQASTAIVGGVVSAIGGTAMGVVAAMDTARKNAEATAKYHQEGREKIQEGLKNLKSYEQLESKIKDVAAEQQYKTDSVEKELIDCLTPKVGEIKNEHLGYLRAKVKVEPNIKLKNAIIDGSVLVNLYNSLSGEIIAKGYFVPNFSAIDMKETGFNKKSEYNILLKVEGGKYFSKKKGYDVKLSNPNLWVVKLKN